MGLGVGLGLNAPGGAIWSPLSLGSSLALWLRADLGVTLNGATVSAWADQSGNGRHATQTTAADQPAFRAAGDARGIGGNASVDFDGASDSLGFADVFSALATGAEIFFVGRLDLDPPTITTKTGLWTFGSSAESTHLPFTDGVVYDNFGSTARKAAGNPTPSLASPFLYGVKSVANEWTARVNGAQLYTTATSTVGWSATPNLGRYLTNAYLDGVTSEVIMLTAAGATAGNRASVHAYIRSRYGITVA